MMIKRFASYLCVALAMCFGSFSVQAAERIAYAVQASIGFDSHASHLVRHDLTLSQWRQEGQTSNEPVTSNLIALSNHFGLTSAAPFGVPDWDSSSAA